eukprot:273106_1
MKRKLSNSEKALPDKKKQKFEAQKEYSTVTVVTETNTAKNQKENRGDAQNVNYACSKCLCIFDSKHGLKTHEGMRHKSKPKNYDAAKRHQKHENTYDPIQRQERYKKSLLSKITKNKDNVECIKCAIQSELNVNIDFKQL